MIAAFINTDKNDKAADEEKNINTDRSAETGKWCGEMDKDNKQGSNAPQVLNGFKAIHSYGNGNLRPNSTNLS